MTTGVKVPRVLLYSECAFFAGCENLVLTLCNSAEICKNTDLSFAYGFNAQYREGLREKMPAPAVPVLAIRVLTLESFLYRLQLWESSSTFARTLSRPLRITIILLRRTGLLLPWNFFVFALLLLTARPDIVHINNGGYPGAYGSRLLSILTGFLGIPTLMTVNNVATPRKFLAKFSDALILGHLRRLVTASGRAANALHERRGVPESRLCIIPNTMVTPTITANREELSRAWNFPTTNFILVQVGLLTERKGQRFSVSALRNIRDRDPGLAENLTLILVGDGEDRPALEKIARELGVASQVIFTGNRTDYANFIGAADVLLQPSTRNEDMPLSILSAMELGKPVIGSDAGGIAEQVGNGREGLIVPVSELGEIAIAITRLAKESDFRTELGRNAQRKFRTMYAPEPIQHRYLELYRNSRG